MPAAGAECERLAVFTQDYRISQLTDDAATIEQEYVVEVAGELAENGLKLLNHGLSFNGKPLPRPRSAGRTKPATLRLKGVRPGQIAHMCDRVGLQIVSMRRLRIAARVMSRMPSGNGVI